MNTLRRGARVRAFAFTMLVALYALSAYQVVLADERAKQVAMTGVGYLYLKNTGALTNVHFSVSHRLAQPVIAMTFAMAFRSPTGTVLKTERFRKAFQWTYEGKLFGSPLARDDVYQVQHDMHPNVQGFCTGTCGTVQVRVTGVETE